MPSPDDAAGRQRMSVRIDAAQNSAFNFGDHGSAQTTNITPADGRDAVQQELLAAVRSLREDLGRLVATEATEVLDAELVATEQEIVQDGAVQRGRLERLSTSMAAVGEAVTALGSGVAVGQAVATLLGG